VLRRLKAVHTRHLDVHEGAVRLRLQAPEQRQRLLPTARFADDRKPGRPAQPSFQELQELCLVVHEQH
jgi:hypothetical protein